MYILSVATSPKQNDLDFSSQPLACLYFLCKSKPPYNSPLPPLVSSFCVRVAIVETFSNRGHSDQHLLNVNKAKEISACAFLVFN